MSKHKKHKFEKPNVTILPVDNDEALLETLFSLSERDLKASLREYFGSKGYHYQVSEGFLYVEGTHPVLLVAHLDTVHSKLPYVICKSKDNDIWMSPLGIGGDDRNGVYIILKLLEKFKCHVVFCEKEEVGGIGASRFAKSGIAPDVQYIVEFDRKGADDCVFYDCDNPEFESFVESFGFKSSWGTFSDISTIAPKLGIAAVNLSSGYENAHTNYEIISRSVIQSVIDRSAEMLSHVDTKFEYIPCKTSYSYSGAIKSINSYANYSRTYNSYGGYYDRYSGYGSSYNDNGYDLIPGGPDDDDVDDEAAYEDGKYGVYERDARAVCTPFFDDEEYVYGIKKLFLFEGLVFDENAADYYVNEEDGMTFLIDKYNRVYEYIYEDYCIERPALSAMNFDMGIISYHDASAKWFDAFSVKSESDNDNAPASDPAADVQ